MVPCYRKKKEMPKTILYIFRRFLRWYCEYDTNIKKLIWSLEINCIHFSEIFWVALWIWYKHQENNLSLEINFIHFSEIFGLALWIWYKHQEIDLIMGNILMFIKNLGGIKQSVALGRCTWAWTHTPPSPNVSHILDRNGL